MKKILFTSVILLLALALNGQVADTLRQQYVNYMLEQYVWLPDKQWNLANIHRYNVRKYRQFEMAYDGNNQKNISLFHEGNTMQQASLKYKSYQKIKTISILSDFSYQKGLQKQLQWSDVADYEKLYPYIIADSSLGNVFFESYSMGGDFCKSINNSYLSAGLNYRAEGRYRKQDPRVKNTVSDLTAQLAWQQKFKNYYFGIDAKYNTYQQSLTSIAKRPDRTDFYYVLTGLGNYDHVFSYVRDHFSGKYFGNQYAVSLQALPVNENRPWVALSFLRQNFRFAYEGQETLSDNKTYVYRLELGYRFFNASFLQHLRLNALMKQQKGTEYYYESVIVDEQTLLTDLHLLATSEKFSSTRFQLKLSAYFKLLQNEKQHLYAEIFTRYHKANELYRFPKSEQSIDKLKIGVHFISVHFINKYLLNFKGGIQYNPVLFSDFSYSNINSAPVKQLVIPDFYMLRQDYASYSFETEYVYPLNRVALHFRLGFTQVFRNHAYGSFGHLALGLQF